MREFSNLAFEQRDDRQTMYYLGRRNAVLQPPVGIAWVCEANVAESEYCGSHAIF
jgi:hypothetical protein